MEKPMTWANALSAVFQRRLDFARRGRDQASPTKSATNTCSSAPITAPMPLPAGTPPRVSADQMRARFLRYHNNSQVRAERSMHLHRTLDRRGFLND